MNDLNQALNKLSNIQSYIKSFRLVYNFYTNGGAELPIGTTSGLNELLLKRTQIKKEIAKLKRLGAN